MAKQNGVAPRPLSPHLQIYRPQLTSVLSISHRVSGIALSAASLLLVYWLVALAGGQSAYEHALAVLGSWWSQLILFLCTFAFFFHLANGIRHLYWDSGRGFDMPSVYASGWTAVIAAAVLTVLTWIMLAVLY
jgi:succinate dehydrogenase / fumarate reductase cytochrome b subunit